MNPTSRPQKRPIRMAAAVAVLGVSSLLLTSCKPNSVTFSLFPAKSSIIPCLSPTGQTPRATVTVNRGGQNDTLTLKVSNLKPGLAFDVFTVEKSPQLSDGKPDPAFKNFGLAWYQSDLEVNQQGDGSVTLQTILLDQIFGFDANTALPPTNTFHLGFWFNDPKDAAPCGFTGFTPFNGEHHAGPVAMITRPDASSGLGPLCTDPSTTPGHCNP